MSSLNTGIYQLDRLPFSSREFHKKFTSIAGPLSLFEIEDNPEVGNVNPEVERPLTPVEEAIKAPPSSFSAFAKLIRPRLLPRNIITGISISDQNELIGVLMNEINSIWGEMKSIPPDPFLSHEQNMELQRRLAIEVVIIAQGLFVKYLDKAQKLNDRAVFSGAANMSRLKTQLALDANKSFNVLSIRRDLAMDIKHPLDGSTVSSSRFSLQKFLPSTPPPDRYKPLVIRQEDKRTRVHYTKEEKLQRRMDFEINDLQRKMPTVVAEQYYGMVPVEALLRQKTITDTASMKSAGKSEIEEDEDRGFYSREKCDSEPYVPMGESLFEELGIDVEQHNRDVKRRVKSARKFKEANEDMEEKTSVKEPEPGSSEYAAEDLKRLLASRSGRPLKGELQGDQQQDDLPPLLQALALHSMVKPKKRQHVEDTTHAQPDELCSHRSSVIGSTRASSVALDPMVTEESITEFSGEEHPQPSVVSQRLPDKSVVRTSDVRVSNRVNKSSVTLTRYPTVYNDLTGEIEPRTVKWLDRNLFIGEEIKEVYEEIIRTMRTDHLRFDADSFVEGCATNVDISLCTASSSVTKGRGERILNPALHRDMLPPWGEDTADNWRNSPKFGGLGREDILQAKIGKGAEGGTGSKSYNSWLAWWRSTITYDDYLKYLSTQENDYLSIIFHLYDSDQVSDDEDGSLDNRPDTIQMALMREREKKLDELKTQKTDFKPGFWNANSVLLGGLGQDPIIEEDEIMAAIKTPFLSTADTAPQGRLSTQSIGSQKSDASDKRSILSKDSISDKRVTKDRKKTGVSFDKRSESSTSGAGKSDISVAPPTISAQDRLERLWTLLCMPDAQRLDMAIKYSAEPHSNNLLQALDYWETAAEVVLERESLMTKLEDFERTASDPNRFFERGSGGGALSRIRESKAREHFDKRLSELDREVKRTVTAVRKRFGDTVTFQGRPYFDKIQVDRTEMLYWLQQERRQNAIDAELVKAKEITLRVPELPSIATDTLL